MDNLEAVLAQIWNYLNEQRGYYRWDFLSFAEALKELHPELSYSEYKTIAKKLFAKMGRTFDWVSVPEAFEWFADAMIHSLQPFHVLVPFATGLECDLFTDAQSTEYYFYNKDFEKATQLFADIITIDSLPEAGSYDLIVAAIPLDSISPKSISCGIVERCSKLISADGFCVFTFPKAIAFSSAFRWLSKLAQEGFYCNAVIDMPAGSYSPVTLVDSEIVVFSRKKQDKRFTALLESEDYAATIVENFLNQRAAKGGPKLGV